MTKTTRRFNPLVGLIVALVGLAALLVTQHLPNRHRMEADLTQRSQVALRSAGLSQVRVTFTGRDGKLQAGSPAEAERALGVVRALEGVRAAQAQVPAPSPETVAPSPVPPSVLLAWQDGRFSMSGTVPTEVSRTALLGATVTIFGAGTIDDRLTVDKTVGDAALAGLPGVLRAIGKDARNTTVQLTGGTLVLSGMMPSEVRKDSVLTAARRIGASIVDRLQIPDLQKQLSKTPPLTFRVDSNTLTSASAASLITVGRILNDNPSARIRIEGFTDSSGPAESNLALSRDRASAVLDFLVTRGVTAERMSAKGYGESHPKFPNTSTANRSANRRVELVVSNHAPGRPGGPNGS